MAGLLEHCYKDGVGVAGLTEHCYKEGEGRLI